MAKKVVGSLKLQIKAGQANPSPPVGPALGQRGINIMAFCKEFNAKTQEMEQGSPVPVVITYYADKSFTFETKTPPASFLLKKAAGLKPVGKRNRASVLLNWAWNYLTWDRGPRLLLRPDADPSPPSPPSP